jgi:hypothetical protein
MIEGGIGLGQTILIQGPGQMGFSCIIGAREANAGYYPRTSRDAKDSRWRASWEPNIPST